MSVTHIVHFQFKPSADTVAINDPYIKSSSGGTDNSLEGMQKIYMQMFANFLNTGKNGITHAFVVEFANKEDRDYYVQKDPAHQEFVKSLDGIVEKAQVIDFTNRVF